MSEIYRAARYVARPLNGTGKATIMHARRGPTVEEHVGVQIVPGTLNASLDRPFDWSGAAEIPIPDAVSWSDLGGEWFTSTARIQPVTIAGIPAWAMRLERSRAPMTLVELVSDARLRDRIHDWPATLEIG